MATREFKVGDYVFAEDSAYASRDKITAIEQSTGSRKGQIYKVGINWFFADELRPDFEAMTKNLVKNVGGVVSFTNTEDKLKFRHKKDTHTLTGLCQTEHFVYAITSTGEIINLCYLSELQHERIYNYFKSWKKY